MIEAPKTAAPEKGCFTRTELARGGNYGQCSHVPGCTTRLREAVEHGYPHHTLTLEDGRALLAEIDRLRAIERIRAAQAVAAVAASPLVDALARIERLRAALQEIAASNLHPHPTEIAIEALAEDDREAAR